MNKLNTILLLSEALSNISEPKPRKIKLCIYTKNNKCTKRMGTCDGNRHCKKKVTR
jgi:hypothetical protein